jgi:catechol 2,3-dioxygenase-like lactoylglutathione lyase family enzyme
MDADRDSNAPRPEISAHVGSCVIRVRELDPSLKFYSDVFSCNVAVREADMALLVAPNGFHIYLHAPSRRGRAAITAGVQLPAAGHRHRIRSGVVRPAAARPCGLPPHRKRSDRH